MKRPYFILILLTTLSCDQKISQSHGKLSHSKPHSIDHLYGNWLNKEYFDSINDPAYEGSLDASYLGLTEIIISPELMDSVLLLNQDLEGWMEKMEIVSEDSLLLNLTDEPFNYIVYNPATQMLEYRIDERYPTYHFYKAPDSLKEGEQAFIKSVNAALSRYVYWDAGDNRYPESRGKIRLDTDGRVFGLEDYKTYRIYVNGTSGDIQGASRIAFSDGTRVDIYGIKLTPLGFDLYTLQPFTNSSESLRSGSGSLYKSFRREI